MCFVISIVLLVLSYSFYIKESFLASGGSFFVSLFFIYLMIKNIKYVKDKKRDKSDS